MFIKLMKDTGIKLKLMGNLFQCHNARSLQEPQVIADKCEMPCDVTEDGEEIECDQVAVGVCDDNLLVCESCAATLEDDGRHITYYGDDC